MLRNAAFALLLALLCSFATAAQAVQTPQAKVNIIIDRETIRFAPQELAIEMRLAVTDQAGGQLYDSGPLPVSTLDWFLRDDKGEAVKGGLYLYTLTIKDAAGESRERRGYLIVNRVGDAERVYIATGDKVAIGAGNEVPQVTVVGSPEATVGGAELPGGERSNYVASGRSLSVLSERAGLQRDVRGRTVTEASMSASAEQGLRLAPNGTPNQVPKFDADGTSLINSLIRDVGGQVSINSPLMVGTNGGAFGRLHVVEPASTIVETLFFENNSTANVTSKGTGIGFYGRDTAASLKNTGRIAVLPVDSNWVDSYLALYTRSSDALSERVRITSSGNVGIGTTNPSTKLEIAGNALIYPSSGPGTLQIRNRTSSDFSQVVFVDETNTYRGYIGYIGANAFNPPRTDTVEFGTFQKDMTFRPNEFEVMRLTAFGKVGIGTVSPGAKLHVEGGFGIGILGRSTGDYGELGGPSGVVGESLHGAGVSGTGGFYGVSGHSDNGTGVIGSSSNGFAGFFSGKVSVSGKVGIGTSNPGSNLHVNVPSSGTPISALTIDVQSFQTTANAAASHYFKVSDIASGQPPAFLVRGDGNVGIGIAAPSAKLHVNGILRVDGIPGGGGANLCLSAMNEVAFCSSSLRYKSNIAQFGAGLSVVNKLRPITFNWKANGEADLGLGAEDVAEVEPLLVTHNKKGEVEGVKYDRVGVVLVNAIKEQQAQLEQQQAQIARLQQQKAVLERHTAEQDARLRTLEQQLRQLTDHSSNRGNTRASAGQGRRR